LDQDWTNSSPERWGKRHGPDAACRFHLTSLCVSRTTWGMETHAT